MDYVLIAFASQVLVFFSLIVAYEAKRKFQTVSLKYEKPAQPAEVVQIWRKAS